MDSFMLTVEYIIAYSETSSYYKRFLIQFSEQAL